MVSEPDLRTLPTSSLLGLSRAILAELKRRGVVRTGNAPAGDYAELLVRVATDGELAPSSQKSWDVLSPDGARLQVKARVVTDPRSASERQLSAFRSWDFDAAVIVLFDDRFDVWRASRVPVEALQASARRDDHVGGFRVLARDELLDVGDDWTALLRAAAGA